MKVVCKVKAHHMWNYTVGGVYDLSIKKSDIDGSFYQGNGNIDHITTAIQRDGSEVTITDDRGMKMFWLKSEMRWYFIPLREHNLNRIL